MNEPQQQQPAHQHGHRHPKMNILKHTHKSRKSCLICRVVGHKSPAEKPGRRELYPRELFVTNGPKKSANHERPAGGLWHTFLEQTFVGELPSSGSLVRSMECPARAAVFRTSDNFKRFYTKMSVALMVTPC